MINNTILQGRLVRDPELSTTASGVEVCKFTVAWSKKYKEVETQLFLNCIAWRATGVFVSNFFKKGQEIAVKGVLSSRSYTDKDGNKRTTIELTCDDVSFCGNKANNNFNDVAQNGTTSDKKNSFNTEEFEEIDSDVDLPF